MSRGVVGVSDWCNRGSVIKGEIDVAISCGGGSDEWVVVGTVWGLNP